MLKLIDNVPSNPIIIYNHLKGKKRKKKKKKKKALKPRNKP
jgi:hypothetical protein